MRRTTPPRPARRPLLRLAALALLCVAAAPGDDETVPQAAPATLEETRITLGKWIETQQIISKERNDWQAGREVMVSRTELAKKEVATLEERIATARATANESAQKRTKLVDENAQLETATKQLTETVIGLEADIRRLFPTLPEPIRTRLQPLFQRIPEDAAKTHVSVAERYQNVLGILNELNKANNDIAVSYEVHTLSDGKPSEVKVIYVGLAQAFYVSSGGEAGIGRPTETGWTWEPRKDLAGDVLKALEILQGKQSPAFVPLPVRLK